MATLQSAVKVLIVGAGVSGLALAQILRKHGIDFEIFERDDGKSSQGWTLDLTQASPNQASGHPDSLAFINGRTHDLIGVYGSDTSGRPMVMIDRNSLRRILSKGLNVQYRKYLSSYEVDQSGVQAIFQDGTMARGSILVGADGSRSRVRSQLLYPFQAVTSKAVILNGEVELTQSEYEPILRLGNNGVLFGEPGLKGAMFIGEWLDVGKALFHWTCAWLDGDPEQNHAWSEMASREELHGKAVQLTVHLPSYLADAVKRTGPAGMQKPPIKLVETVLKVDRLPDGPVTILGDAAHSMVPFRGMGANTAVLDACDLAQHIIQGIGDGRETSAILRAYEEQMIPRGRTKVLESRADAESDSNFDVSGGRLERMKGEQR